MGLLTPRWKLPGSDIMAPPLPPAGMPGADAPDLGSAIDDNAIPSQATPRMEPPPPPSDPGLIGVTARLANMPPPMPSGNPKAFDGLKTAMPEPTPPALNPIAEDSGEPPSKKAAALQTYMAMQAPQVPKPNLAQRLAAIAVGGMAGWSNAAGRARPIDIGATMQNILRPGYAQQVADYGQQREQALGNVKAAEAMDNATALEDQRKARAEEWKAQAKQREEDSKRKVAEDADKRQQAITGVLVKGWQQIPAGSPLPPGYVKGTLYGQDFAVPTDDTSQQKRYVPVPKSMKETLGITEDKVDPSVLKDLTQIFTSVYKADNKEPANPTEAALAERAANGDKVADAALSRLDKSRRDSRPITNISMGAGGSGLSDDAINMYAKAVANGAQMPSLGNGKEGAAMRKEISNRAATVLAGGDLAGNAADYKGQAASIRQSTTAANALQRSEQSLNGHLGMLLDASKEASRTGSPLVNHLVLWAKGKAVGDPATQKYLQMATEAKMEYAKILSGGVTSNAAITEGAMREADKLFSENFGQGSVENAANTIKQVAAIKSKAFSDSLKRQREQIRSINNPQSRKDSSPTGKPITQALAQDYYKKSGGDPAKARAMAISDGYDPSKVQ